MQKEEFIFIALALTLMTFQPAVACDQTSIVNAIGQDPIYQFGRDTKLSCVGTISAGTRQYLIAYYDWNETYKKAKARGGFPHAAHRVLVFETAHHKLNYLGFYGVETPPLGTSGAKIRFVHRWDGGEIVFGKDGPPAHALIDGEPIGLSK